MKKRTIDILRFTMLALFAGFAFTSCTEDKTDDHDAETPSRLSNGFYVLCEGAYSQNNSALDFYDIQKRKTSKDLFLSVNAAGLGDTANDMLEAEGKIFVVVNLSNCVMVVDKASCKRLALIPLTQGANPQPRCIAYHGGRVYVSCFDGSVYKINASSYEIEKVANTGGRNPEAIAVCAGRLFVANTGGMDFPNFDNSISVMSLDNLSVETKIEGLLNPGRIAVFGNQILVQARGTYDYESGTYKDSELVRINASTLQVEERVNKVMNDFCALNDKVLFISTTSDFKTRLYTLPIGNLACSETPFAEGETETLNDVMSPYFVGADNRYVYLTDAKDYQTGGECLVFDHSGKKLYQFPTSINPKNVIAVQ